MKNFHLLLIILPLIWGCSQNKSECCVEAESQAGKEETKKNNEKIIPETSLSSKSSIIEPCREVQDFVKQMEKLNLVHDTLRLTELPAYAALDSSNIKYFNNRPFYRINFEESKINKSYKSHILSSDYYSLDIDLFMSADIIWAYFYRCKDSEVTIPDGVIEQWVFKSEEKAEKARAQISEVGSIIYFNTTPFFHRIRNNLIIFHTRAAAFSYEQKELFDVFVEGMEGG